MPCSALAFRSVCGNFLSVFISFMTKRAKFKAAMRIGVLRLRNRVHGAMLGLLLVLLFYGDLLYQCGDVELNPGPNRKTEGRQSTLSGIGSSSRRDSADKSRPPEATTPTRSPDPASTEVMDAIRILQGTCDRMSRDLAEIKTVCTNLEGEVNSIKQGMKDLKTENESLRKENEKLNERTDFLERKVDDLEGRSKRNNIIIHGIPRNEKETWQDCEDLVHETFTDKLEFSRNISFDRVHRLSAKPNAPIVACCTFFKDKGKILQAKQKLKGSGIFIGEDFSFRVREIRRKLVPHLKTARSQDKRASLVYDHLVIEGQKFGLDDRDQLCPLQ